LMDQMPPQRPRNNVSLLMTAISTHATRPCGA
jgi:hypothetical protein